jgi:hypothetical protein
MENLGIAQRSHSIEPKFMNIAPSKWTTNGWQYVLSSHPKKDHRFKRNAYAKRSRSKLEDYSPEKTFRTMYNKTFTDRFSGVVRRGATFSE